MSLVCITQSAKHFTFLKMPETFLLLFSFEGAILHKDSAEQIFIGEAEAVKRPYADSTWLETAREVRELPV